MTGKQTQKERISPGEVLSEQDEVWMLAVKASRRQTGSLILGFGEASWESQAVGPAWQTLQATENQLRQIPEGDGG